MQTDTFPQQGFMPQVGVIPSFPTISMADLEQSSMSVEESESKIDNLIHDFYHKQA